MLRKYLGSFLIVLVAVCGICSTLTFATRSHVRAGDAVEETFNTELTLDASAGSNQFYPVDADIKSDLEKGVTFIGSGAARVTSVKVDVTAKEVSWTRDKIKYKAPGTAMVAHVKWETPADAANGATGDIQIKFPKIRGVSSYEPSFHSGGYQKTGDGRLLFREITVYQGALSLALGRFFFSLSVGLPITLLIHGIWWAFQVKREKRLRLAALAPADPDALPRTYYSNPTAEWFGWTFTLIMFGVIGSLMASFVIHDGYLSSTLDWVLIIMQAVGIAIGLIVIWGARISVVTVRIDADTLSLAKGRGEPRWNTARWADLKSALTKSRTYKGTTTEWVEVQFPDGKTRKIPAGVEGFAELRDRVLTIYALHHAPI